MLPESAQDSFVPLISVIVPAHNEARYIADCLASIERTAWPPSRLEVVVVDNCSSDGTGNIARELGAQVVQVNEGRIGAIRNAGLRAARGEYVAYVDGDCTVASTWLRSAVDLLARDPGIGAVGGPCLAPRTGTWVERALANTDVTCRSTCRVATLATSSFVARRQLILDLGGFNEQLRSGEDTEISLRIASRNLELRSTADCHVVHYGYPSTLLEVLKKQIWHGSNQLEAGGLSLTLLFSHGALAGLLAAAGALLLSPWNAPAAGMLLAGAAAALIIPALFYAIKRLRSERERPGRLTSWFAIGLAYFLGRALGLAGNYARRLSGRLRTD